jgi:hypothetical protein
VLNHCTLTGNSAWQGGGSFGGTLSNCVLTGNVSTWLGGGASDGTLNNCTLSGNSAQYGGAANMAMLNNCTITRNSASHAGGGISWIDYNWFPLSPSSGIRPRYVVNNCIVQSNNAPSGPNYYYDYGDWGWPPEITVSHSCITPLPTNGIGNITNAPMFVDAAAGDFRLQSNSPCINAGRNADAPAGPDLDSNPRIAGGTIDIGAYEFQSPQSTLSYAWLQQYGLPTDGSADLTDPDSDGHNNWQEWRTWTDPTNSLSALRLLAPIPAANGIQIRWHSVSGQTYFLDRSTNLGTVPAFSPFVETVLGQTGTTFFTDTNAVGAGPFYYRVGVRE